MMINAHWGGPAPCMRERPVEVDALEKRSLSRACDALKTYCTAEPEGGTQDRSRYNICGTWYADTAPQGLAAETALVPPGTADMQTGTSGRTNMTYSVLSLAYLQLHSAGHPEP